MPVINAYVLYDKFKNKNKENYPNIGETMGSEALVFEARDVLKNAERKLLAKKWSTTGDYWTALYCEHSNQFLLV